MNIAVRSWFCRFSVFCAFLVLSLSAMASDKSLDASRVDDQPASLTQYFSVLLDPSGKLTLADVQKPEIAARFKGDQANAPSLAYGFTPDAYWLRLQVRNPTAQPVQRMLEIGYVRLASVEFHQVGDQGVVQSVTTGFSQPFATRPYANRFFVFPLTVPAQADQFVFLRVQSVASLQVPATLWTPQAFHEHEVADYLGQAAYFGSVAGIVLFNLFLFLALRDRLYLLYVISTVFFSLGVLSESGLGNQYLWHDAPGWAMASGLGFYTLSALVFLPFLRQMLSTASLTPRLDRAVQASWFAYLSILIGLAISYPLFVKPFNFVMLAGLALQVSISLWGTFQRQRSAYFFLAAYGAFFVAAGLNGARSLGLIAFAIPASNLIQIGSATEMVVLAFALADRYHTLRKETSQAQAKAIAAQNETLKAQAETFKAQTEKMTLLMQLVTNVAHEVNTPIGAVKASSTIIIDALDEALAALPRLTLLLDAGERALFAQLIGHAGHTGIPMTTREERTIKNQVRQQLEDAGIGQADPIARVLVGLRAQGAAMAYLPLLRHAESAFILQTAASLGSIVNSASNIRIAVDRVARIVTTLKSYSQADEVVLTQNLAVQEGVESVLSLYANRIKQGIEVVRRYESAPVVFGRAEALMEVWTQLVHNALQAMGPKGTLTITIRQVGQEAVVCMADSGVGIPQEIRDRIFQPFFTTRPTGEGAGLGLAIVQKIVDQHHGRVEVHSQAGVGTRFTVFLPLNQPEASLA